jgi:hypothetical protein
LPKNTYSITFEYSGVLKAFFENEKFNFDVYQSSEEELPFSHMDIKYEHFKIVISCNEVLNE